MKRMKRLHGVTLLVIAAAAIAAGVWFLNGGPGEPAAQTAAGGSGQAAGGAQAAALAEPPGKARSVSPGTPPACRRRWETARPAPSWWNSPRSSWTGS